MKPETTLDPATLSGRDLDAAVAEYVLGWKPLKIGKDIDGKNQCEILTPTGRLPKGFQLPNTGKIHRGFMVPEFHRRLSDSIHLAKKFGQTAIDISVPLSEIPTRICRHHLNLALKARKTGRYYN